MYRSEALINLGIAGSHYLLSNQMAPIQQENEPGLKIGFSAAERIYLLIDQMRVHIPKLNNFRLSWIPIVMGGLGITVFPLVKSYLENHPNPASISEKVLTAICGLTAKIGEANTRILQNADKLLNTAYFVSSIALISLGFPVNGFISLFSLSLLALTRHHYLPASIETCLNRLSELAILMTIPTPILVKTLAGAGWAGSVALDLKMIRSRLPRQITNPFSEKFISGNSNEILDEVLANLQKADKFSINPTYVYFDKVEGPFPIGSTPRTKEIACAMHDTLSKIRGKILSQTIQRFKDSPPLDKIENALWHRIRTFRGELTMQPQMSISKALFLRYLISDGSNSDPSANRLESIYITEILEDNQKQFSLTADHTDFMNNLPRIMSPVIGREKTIREFADAIRREVPLNAEGTAPEDEPKITWETILAWAEDIKKRRNLSPYENEKIKPEWATCDDTGKYYLTVAGIRLLLWDLGVLSFSSR